MTIHHYLPASKKGDFRVSLEAGPEGGTHHMCKTRSIYDMADNAFRQVFHHRNLNIYSSLPEIESKRDTI
jgi:hypothetical protein